MGHGGRPESQRRQQLQYAILPGIFTLISEWSLEPYSYWARSRAGWCLWNNERNRRRLILICISMYITLRLLLANRKYFYHKNRSIEFDIDSWPVDAWNTLLMPWRFDYHVLRHGPLEPLDGYKYFGCPSADATDSLGLVTLGWSSWCCAVWSCLLVIVPSS